MTGRAASGSSLLRKFVWAAVLGLIGAGVAAYYYSFRASVTLSSEPAGADVSIDGRRIGRTPLPREWLTPGLHHIELRHSHYAVHERQLALAAGENVDLHVELAVGRGELVVFSNPRGAWVEVDGERRPGTTPLVLNLVSGPHQIALGMEERRQLSEQVVVMANQRREVRLDLAMDPHGSLVVETVPADARVSLPDAGVDYQPGIRLPLSEYRVRVSHPAYATQELRLKVRYGENVYPVRLDLQFAELEITAQPPDSRVRVRYREAPDEPLMWHDYRQGLRVPVGEVAVRASAMGRRSEFRRLDLGASGKRLHLTLAPMRVEVGSRIRDDLTGGGTAPEMIVLPPGEFVMGHDAGPPSEQPARRIRLTEPFAISVTEVTAADYRRFAAATGRAVDDRLTGMPDVEPAVYVSFADATAYADWLSEGSSARYRLPSEAEWEYMARGGTTTDFFFGDDRNELCAFANVADLSMRTRHRGFDTADCDDGFVQLAPVGSFPPNGFGVHDVHGNAAEWVLECGMPGYAGGADDGTPLDEGISCPTHGVRGGSWDDAVSDARAGKRGVASSASQDRGIRLLREL